MAIVPKITRPMPEWAKTAVEHLEYVAYLLAENGMDIQANRLDRTISVIHRYVRDPKQTEAALGRGGGGHADPA